MAKTKKAKTGPHAGSSETAAEPKARPLQTRDASLDRSVQDRIGSHLRTMYDDIKAEPVPERFLQLLQQLDKAGKTD